METNKVFTYKNHSYKLEKVTTERDLNGKHRYYYLIDDDEYKTYISSYNEDLVHIEIKRVIDDLCIFD